MSDMPDEFFIRRHDRRQSKRWHEQPRYHVIGVPLLSDTRYIRADLQDAEIATLRERIEELEALPVDCGFGVDEVLRLDR